MKAASWLSLWRRQGEIQERALVSSRHRHRWIGVTSMAMIDSEEMHGS
jgi:hypothetical protein